MIGTIIANILRFLFLVLVQALVLDHLDVANGYIVPYLYILFLLMLPFEVPAWAGLFIGTGTGMVMDMFSDTPGMHMSACTVMMYLRIYMLRLLRPREGYEFGMRPTVPRMGMAWFVTYAGILILVHHLWLFFIEMFRFDMGLVTLSRAVLSAAFTLLLCLLAQFLTTSPERVRT
jgi:rod shape-determining protein MreD